MSPRSTCEAPSFFAALVIPRRCVGPDDVLMLDWSPPLVADGLDAKVPRCRWPGRERPSPGPVVAEQGERAGMAIGTCTGGSPVAVGWRASVRVARSAVSLDVSPGSIRGRTIPPPRAPEPVRFLPATPRGADPCWRWRACPRRSGPWGSGCPRGRTVQAAHDGLFSGLVGGTVPPAEATETDHAEHSHPRRQHRPGPREPHHPGRHPDHPFHPRDLAPPLRRRQGGPGRQGLPRRTPSGTGSPASTASARPSRSTARRA